MAYQALYRKYRPQTFSDVVGQEHITETLKNELAAGKIVHAYLFTGTRGTGKTSCAKILAKAVNCLNPINGDPCGECEMCRAVSEGEITDISEIDAASNNGVDSIRELREQVSFAPAMGKYRVYIIDEVHMLSIGAFNALLKTLEEPPSHVVFILATTEVHKLPATILSRCQRFDFRRIDSQKICDRLHFIAENEGLKLSDDAATLIASAADGGMRDALSILDLCASSSTDITEDTVSGVCSMAGNDYLIKLADIIKSGNTEAALMLLDELHNSSVDMLRLLSELTRHYRDLMIVKTVKSSVRPIVCSAARLKELERQAECHDIREIMAVLGVLQSAAAGMQTGNRRCEMEMTLIKLCNPKIGNDLHSLEMRLASLERDIASGNFKIARLQANPIENNAFEDSTKEEDEIYDEAAPYLEDTDSADSLDISESQYITDEAPLPTAQNSADDKPIDEWDDIIAILETTCPLIAGVLKGSNAYVKGAYLLIDTQNGQFKTMINSANTTYRDSIRKAAQQVLGVTYKLGPYRSVKTDNSDPLSAFAEKLRSLENN